MFGNRYGYIDHRVGNKVIILTSFMIWYSGFLPYHKELVEGSEKCNQMDVSLSMICFILNIHRMRFL